MQTQQTKFPSFLEISILAQILIFWAISFFEPQPYLYNN